MNPRFALLSVLTIAVAVAAHAGEIGNDGSIRVHLPVGPSKVLDVWFVPEVAPVAVEEDPHALAAQATADLAADDPVVQVRARDTLSQLRWHEEMRDQPDPFFSGSETPDE